MIDAALKQQLPADNNGQDVAHEVVRLLAAEAEHAWLIPDIEARVASGEKKYGCRLRTNNGRDVDLDLYQEVLDSINYTTQAFLQTGKRCYLDIFYKEVEVATEVKAILVAQQAPASDKVDLIA